MNTATVISIFVSVIHISGSARILGIIPIPSYSHQVAFRPIWKSLSLRGHQVTVITTDPIHDSSLTNLREIDIRFSYKYFQGEVIQNTFMDEESNSVLKYMKMFLNLMEIMPKMTGEQFKFADVQHLIKNRSVHFDVVMLELFNPAMLAFGQRFGCPVIGLLSMDGLLLTHETMGNPTNPTAYPDLALPFKEGKLTFIERLQSFIHSILVRLIDRLLVRPSLDPIVKDNFGVDYPAIEDMLLDVDMLFLNTNPILSSIRPIVPAVIHFGGGTHLERLKPLPAVSELL